MYLWPNINLHMEFFLLKCTTYSFFFSVHGLAWSGSIHEVGQFMKWVDFPRISAKIKEWYIPVSWNFWKSFTVHSYITKDQIWMFWCLLNLIIQIIKLNFLPFSWDGRAWLQFHHDTLTNQIYWSFIAIFFLVNIFCELLNIINPRTFKYDKSKKHTDFVKIWI